MKDAYDFVIIDGAAKLADITASALRVADFVLIPIRHSGYDMWAVEGLVEAIRARQNLTRKPDAAFVVSCQVTGSRLAQAIAPALKEFDLPILEARTSRRVAYEEAGGMGVTVLDLVGREKAAQEIQAITKQLLNQVL